MRYGCGELLARRPGGSSGRVGRMMNDPDTGPDAEKKKPTVEGVEAAGEAAGFDPGAFSGAFQGAGAKAATGEEAPAAGPTITSTSTRIVPPLDAPLPDEERVDVDPDVEREIFEYATKPDADASGSIEHSADHPEEGAVGEEPRQAHVLPNSTRPQSTIFVPPQPPPATPQPVTRSGFDDPPPRPPHVPQDMNMGWDPGWRDYAAAQEAERQSRLKGAALTAPSGPSASTAPQTVGLTARAQIGQQVGVGTTVTRAPATEDDLALINALPQQITTATQFIMSGDGRIDLLPDPPDQTVIADAAQREQYGEVRTKALALSGIGHNQLGDLSDPVSKFLSVAPEQIEQISIRRLWSRGNTLRRRLAAHDIAASSGDVSDPARLPPLVAESLRDLVETYNIFIIGDPKGRELDQVRLGPQERDAALAVVDVAARIVEAVQVSEGVATVAAIEALSEQVESAQDARVLVGVDSDQSIDLHEKQAAISWVNSSARLSPRCVTKPVLLGKKRVRALIAMQDQPSSQAGLYPRLSRS